MRNQPAALIYSFLYGETNIKSHKMKKKNTLFRIEETRFFFDMSCHNQVCANLKIVTTKFA